MTTTATFHAYFGYRDAVAALRWLEKAFGFETSMEVPDGKGGIMHAEMRYGGVAFTLFTDEQGYDRPTRKGETVGHGMYVAFDTSADIFRLYRVYALPTQFFIGPDGTILDVVNGPLSHEDAQARIEAWLPKD